MTLRKSVSDNEKVKRDSEWHNVDKKICLSLYLWNKLRSMISMCYVIAFKYISLGYHILIQCYVFKDIYTQLFNFYSNWSIFGWNAFT